MNAGNGQHQKTRQGYGRIYEGGDKGKTFLAHRISWQLANGSIPEGKCICHHCDNPGCVNPWHLWSGSHLDNIHDMIDKGRRIDTSGEGNGGSKLTEQDVREILCFLAVGYLQREIADGYGVSQGTISYINTGGTWAWLKEEIGGVRWYGLKHKMIT